MLSAIAICGKSAFWVIPAAPPLEPPVARSLSKGFFGILKSRPTFVLKLPKPNASHEVLPIIIASSLRNL